uniref:U6-Theraphotoxin-Sfo1a_1 n=1 Tax=Selenotholus foelschei TaxID=1905327 RepID=A0A482Z857_9ARAC
MRTAGMLSVTVFLFLVFLPLFSAHHHEDHHEGKDICSLPPDGGMCEAYSEQWYFNGSSCEKFVYGGCGGNANRFATEEDCIATCGKPYQNTD